MSVDVGGVRIAWDVAGDPGGAPIILLHSLGSDREMWRPQVDALSGTHFVVMVDIRGHGRSDAPPGPYTLEVLGTDVVAVADAVGLDRFAVCGVSMGGQMALWLAIHESDRILSVTAANTGAKIGDRSSWGERIEAIRRNGMAEMADGVLARWFSPDFAERHPEWRAAAESTFVGTAPEGYIGCCGALAEADLRSDVASIAAPTLVIGSTLDVSTPPEQAEWIHRHVPGSELEIIEGAGHLSNLDRSDRFTERLRRFLGVA